jgi:NitT/TauT family transport system permease protein
MKVATILAIASEFIGSEHGLGFLIVQVQTSLDTRAMFMRLTLVGVAVSRITIGLAWLCVVKAVRLR